jgi:hypothetical protein
MPSYRARRGPPIDGRCGHIAASTVWLSPQTAWVQIWALASVEGGEPLADSNTGLLGNLELHRPASLLLNDSSAIANSPAGEHVIDPQPHEIAAPELAVDRQIEHRKIASATFYLQPYSNVQTSFGFSGRFWPIRRPLFRVHAVGWG